ncbi:hypothetical protein C9890_0586 [Perkinsus sp. BL_2016]|nr:hypothetical protein C9890_0586 [Perkinsus sp. BL_2016]
MALTHGLERNSVICTFSDAISTADYQTLTYERFSDSFMAKNKGLLIYNVPSPLILEGANKALAENNLQEFLLAEYGDEHIPVSILHANPSETSLRDWYSLGERRPYLKDWHVNRKKRLFRAPKLFHEDWLNSEYEFLYWGCEGSSTPRHSDVLNSFSWSLNLLGVKKWTFYLTSGPVFVYQKSMCAVFVPSGVEHEVENISECISVNCNWFNRHNVAKVYTYLIDERNTLIAELCKFGVTWEIDHDQKSDTIEDMMPAACGLRITEFMKILRGQQCPEAEVLMEKIAQEFPHLV